MCPYWGPGLQPRHVPWLEIKLMTLWFTVWRSIHWAPPARAALSFFNIFLIVVQVQFSPFSPHHAPCPYFLSFLKNILFIFFRERGREGERGNINVWLPLVCFPLGNWPTTQACALTRNWTGNPLVHRPALNPLSHTSQGIFKKKKKIIDWF